MAEQDVHKLDPLGVDLTPFWAEQDQLCADKQRLYDERERFVDAWSEFAVLDEPDDQQLAEEQRLEAEIDAVDEQVKRIKYQLRRAQRREFIAQRSKARRQEAADILLVRRYLRDESRLLGPPDPPWPAHGWPYQRGRASAEYLAENVKQARAWYEQSEEQREKQLEAARQEREKQWQEWEKQVREEQREEQRRNRFQLYSAEELGHFPKVEWFPGLEGVLPKRELVGLWGPGDSYKSFVALDWACYLASLGLTVLYVAAEGASGLQGRIEAWKRHHEVDALATLKVLPAPIRMHEPPDAKAFVEAVEAQLAEDCPVLVVIDTLARNFVGGNENSAQDLGLFVEGAESVRRAFDCAVIVVHHSTKDGSAERGGESLRNATFAMYRFDRGGKLKVTVSCERMKDAEPPRPVVITPAVIPLEDDRTSLVTCWPYGTDLTPPVFDLSSDKEAERRRKMVEEITHYLKRHGSNGERCSQTQVAKNVKGRDATVVALLKELSLDIFSPVQVEKDGKSVTYFHEETSVLPGDADA